MDMLLYMLAGIFLPLFPFSMVFNLLLGRCRPLILRGLMLLLWPQLGLLLLSAIDAPIPNWLVPLAVLTAGLYALRALALRDVGQWGGFLATSAWALLWIPLHGANPPMTLHLYALGFSGPLVLLATLGAGLEQRFGAAYTGLYGGLAESVPRFATVLVFVVLAVIATPLFPAFFIMLATILQAIANMPAIALGVAVVWLLWSWAGARLMQGLIAGSAGEVHPLDLNQAVTWGYTLVLLLLVMAGLYGIRELS
jgi:hypothetical protein